MQTTQTKIAMPVLSNTMQKKKLISKYPENTTQSIVVSWNPALK